MHDIIHTFQLVRAVNFLFSLDLSEKSENAQLCMRTVCTHACRNVYMYGVRLGSFGDRFY